MEPAKEIAAPPIVYFWGAVRDHVNRVAYEYARRIHAAPVWLDVEEDGSESVGHLERPPNARTFLLRAGKDVQLARARTPVTVPTGSAGEAPTDLTSEVHAVLEFPAVVGAALREASRSGRRSTFVLSNIDRLRHLSPMFEHGMGAALVESFRRRGIVLILTSEGLLALPHLKLECAFEVSTLAEERWWEAEVRPGVPVSCCSDCPGSATGAYAICAPDFRLACPVLVPFSEATA